MAKKANNKSFWMYQADSPTPSLDEAIKIGAINELTTQTEWDKLTPGMKREIVRSKKVSK